MRITVLRFTKDAETVADGLATMVEGATITRQVENGRTTIDIEGDFERFIVEDMEMWCERIKFKVIDNAIQDDTDQEARSIFARADPAFGAVLFSPAIAYVYKRTAYVTRTTTITERIEAETVKEVDRNVDEQGPFYDWEDITKEFSRKVKI